MESEHIDTHQKALSLNLDDTIYGSIAEIGAGQEVAGWFFRVGATSGTIAKTVSAYDMKISDEIYGEVDRYVSHNRLLSMIDREYHQLVHCLSEAREDRTRFFSFANTVSARNYQGTNICHGWVGLQFQSSPRSEPNRVILHVNMLDTTNLLQQQAHGILGVNLIYGAFFHSKTYDVFLKSLLDQLSRDRIEIDFIELSGPDFTSHNSFDSNFSLLNNGLSTSVLFNPDGIPQAPVDVLYKRPLVIERGLFQQQDKIYTTLLEAGKMKLNEENLNSKREILTLLEITIKGPKEIEEVDNQDLFQRVQHLIDQGVFVMVSTYFETYHLTSYLKRYTQESIRFVLGIGNMLRILHERYYHDLDSGILTAMSQLLAQTVKMYVCEIDVEELKQQLTKKGFDLTSWELPEKGTANIFNVRPNTALRHLYAYLIEQKTIVPIKIT